MNYDLWPKVYYCRSCGTTSNASVCPACLDKQYHKPLKPPKPQSPCDLGLFSDEKDQLDLADMPMFQD